jgi:hypothetical protein
LLRPDRFEDPREDRAFDVDSYDLGRQTSTAWLPLAWRCLPAGFPLAGLLVGDAFEQGDCLSDLAAFPLWV